MDLHRWQAAYDAARAADEQSAGAAFRAVESIEDQMITAPPSPRAAHACLSAAVNIMGDEAGSEAEEPSYAGLMRAALRHLEPPAGADPTPE